jgi:DNA-binding Lrp family transcriptional regulator
MPSESRTVDDLDRQILHTLQIAPRASFARIATVLEVSEQTVARRYQRLRGAGVVRVLARPEPTRQPGSSYWTLRIGCRPGTAHTLADALARRADTAWVSIGAGGAEVVCQAEIAAGQPGLLNQLPRASNVLTFSAHQLMHRFPGRGDEDWMAPGHELTPDQRAHLTEGTTPAATGLGVAPAARAAGASDAAPAGDAAPGTGRGAVVEPADQPLLDALGRDGRASWASLAAATGWTQRQTAQRVNALIASGAIYFHLDVAHTALGLHLVAALWFTVAPAHLAAVGARLADHDELPFVGAVTGSTNIMASALTRDAEALYRYLTTKVAAIEGIHTVEVVPQQGRVKQSHTLMSNGLVAEPPRR